jgi:hypothetical protein
MGIYGDKQLLDLNVVWMYLQVTTLSDISDAGGTQITVEASKGAKLHDRFSTMKWPRQPIITSTQ